MNIGQARSGGRSGARILIVDDEPDMVAILRLCLAAKGWTIDTALNAEEALLSVKRQRPDLIITDHEMAPGMSGLELCSRLRANAKTFWIPIILHTAIDMRGPREKSPLFDRVLIKPASLAELVRQIRALLRRNRTRGRSRVGPRGFWQ